MPRDFLRDNHLYLGKNNSTLCKDLGRKSPIVIFSRVSGYLISTPPQWQEAFPWPCFPRPKAILVEKESHLLELCRYVVLNPVRAGMVSRPEAIFLEKSYRQAARKFVADGLVVQGRPWKNLSVKFSWEAKVLWRAWRNFPETSEK